MTVNDVARALPGVEELRDHCRGLAMLDAILSPEWEGRYYSFADGTASMRDGQGDEYTIAFAPEGGVYVEGFSHESPMSPWADCTADPEVWPGVLDEVPAGLRAYGTTEVPEPVTACLWREPADPAWRTGTIEFPTWGDGDPDGADYLFHLLTDRSPRAYAKWAGYYYETEVDEEAVAHVLALRPLTPQVVAALNPETDLASLAEDIVEIGYPDGVFPPLPDHVAVRRA
ncbi:hypothetical protein [Streptomyces sp. NPDC048659]|uniref:hypothetical protein n=1 Tax=Streptomyces sp. NPDC048659 TaxID=3155489 RepID=UPI003425774A